MCTCGAALAMAPTASRRAMAVGRSTALPASGRASRIVATPSDTDRSGTVVVTGSSCLAGAVLGRGVARSPFGRPLAYAVRPGPRARTVTGHGLRDARVPGSPARP